MKQSQAEIKAIQAKLQAIQAGRSAVRPPSLPVMAEPTPNTTTTATATLNSRRQQADLATAAEALQQRSASYVKQFHQSPQLSQSSPLATAERQVAGKTVEVLKPHHVSPQPPQLSQPSQAATAERQVVEALKRLEIQAQRINELSVAQEAALRELKTIAERVKRDWKAAELEREPLAGQGAEVPPVCEYIAAAVPHIEKDENGAFVLTTRSVDLFRAEREATMTAQALRYRTNKPSYSSSTRRNGGTSRRRSGRQWLEALGRLVIEQVSAVVSSVATPKVKSSSRVASVRAAEPLEMPSFSVQDAAIWIFGAAVARVGLDLLLASFPGLWIPVIGLIVAPAAIAVYRTTVAPQFGFVWGYRLLLVMIGLLVGGRLL